MSNQDFGRDNATASQSDARGGDKTQNMRDAANHAFSKASDMARDAGEQAKQAASTTASTVAQGAKQILDRQIGTGANMAGHFASSVRLAADDISRESPMIGGFVHSFASKVEGYAEGMQGQTADQLVRNASDFTRREPALVFGLAAVAGFFLLRTMKSAAPVASPPIQPQHES